MEEGSPESLSKDEAEDADAPRKLLPRETGQDIGMGSPVPLSGEAVAIITRLRNMKVSQARYDADGSDILFRMNLRIGVAGETSFSVRRSLYGLPIMS